MDQEKEIRWVGSAYKDLLDFPDDARRQAGFQLCRVMYVAKFEEAVYVLHCFQKKTQATSDQDKNTAEARYRSVVNARKVRK